MNNNKNNEHRINNTELNNRENSTLQVKQYSTYEAFLSPQESISLFTMIRNKTEHS
jgi:hypothetical protein